MKKILTLLCMLCLTSGCTTVLIGGAGAGGYAAGKDERPLSVISDDIAITTTIKAKLIKDKDIDALDINVDTYRGVVTLRGHVQTSTQVSRAVQLSRTVSGVKNVISKLVIIK